MLCWCVNDVARRGQQAACGSARWWLKPGFGCACDLLPGLRAARLHQTSKQLCTRFTWHDRRTMRLALGLTLDA